MSSLKVLVCLGCGLDVKIPLPVDLRSGRVREEWSVCEIDPGSQAALALALELKKLSASRGSEAVGGPVGGPAGGPAGGSAGGPAGGSAAQVTALHLGPAQGEVWLRRALAWGCDRAVRISPGEEAESEATFGSAGSLPGGAAGKAVILAAAAQACGFDLILLGAEGVTEGSGQLGLRLAARLGLPCVTRAFALDLIPQPGAETEEAALRAKPAAPRPPCVEVRRTLEQGWTERVRASLPLVVTVTPEGGWPAASLPVPTAQALLQAGAAELTVWKLADLGVAQRWVEQAGEALTWGPPRERRPRLVPLRAPSSSLPAFERILQLVQGSVRPRQGRVVALTGLPAEAVAEEIFQVLRAEGWLNHLRPPGEPEAASANGEEG